MELSFHFQFPTSTNLNSGETKEAFLQNRVLAIPQSHGGAQDLAFVTDPQQAIFTRHIRVVGSIFIRDMFPAKHTKLKQVLRKLCILILYRKIHISFIMPALHQLLWISLQKNYIYIYICFILSLIASYTQAQTDEHTRTLSLTQYMHTHTHTHTCMHTHTHTHTHMHAHTHTHTHTHIVTHTHMHACTHTHTHTCVHVYTHTHTHTHAHTHFFTFSSIVVHPTAK